jgi:hypothetical protein
MTTHISRDFSPTSTGYFSGFFHTPYLFNLAVFLRNILGFSVVGQSGFDITKINSQSSTVSSNTAIAAASNGQALPQSTINVVSTTGFPTSGLIWVTTSDGYQMVRYSGTTTTTFTNCTGGTGTMTSGSNTTIASGSNNVSLPTATINVEATATASTTIAALSNGVALPTGTINVASTTGFPASGTLNVTTSGGVQTVTYTGKTSTTFTGCAGGTGTMSTGGAVNNTGFFVNFPTSGTIYVQSTTGVQTITYTGLTATTFTGCTGGAGTMNTGNSVASAGVGGVACGQNKIVTASGNPIVITTQFPHGMSTGDYMVINNNGTNSFYGFNNATIGNFGPYKVEVLGINQLRVLWTTVQGFQANTCSIQPQGILIASGTGASINFVGAPSVNAVQVPTATRTVVSGAAPSTGDVGRILVLKSNLYPTKNTGIYKISAVNTGTNSYTIDYRSTDTPPPESGMSWWLYETETHLSQYMLLQDQNRTNGIGLLAVSNTTPIQVTVNISGVSYFETGQLVTIAGVGGNTAANGTWVITRVGAGIFTLNNSSGNGTYTSGGTATRVGYAGGSGLSPNSKIILQSPHSSGWQVRIASEPFNMPITTPYSSISTGYGGTAAGDFTTGGVSTHLEQFLDFNVASPYVGTVIGAARSDIAPRMTLVGDDTGRCVFAYTRNSSGGANGITLFGLPDNEPGGQPNINRHFVYASANTNVDYGGIIMKFGSFNNVGMTYRDLNPEMCAIAGLINADGASTVVPSYSANAGDCPFTGTTELVPWEVWGGVATDAVSLTLPYPSGGITVYSTNPRFMGTAPFLRQGRTNFGSFTLSTENTAAFTVTNATNTSPIQITTSATNSLVTGQTVVISGILGNTAANGTFVVTRIDGTNFTLNGTTGNGTYVSGGTGNGTPGWLHLQNGIYLVWNGAGGLTP